VERKREARLWSIVRKGDNMATPEFFFSRTYLWHPQSTCGGILETAANKIYNPVGSIGGESQVAFVVKSVRSCCQADDALLYCLIKTGSSPATPVYSC
jgi:hypothetical protein